MTTVHHLDVTFDRNDLGWLTGARYSSVVAVNVPLNTMTGSFAFWEVASGRRISVLDGVARYIREGGVWLGEGWEEEAPAETRDAMQHVVNAYYDLHKTEAAAKDAAEREALAAAVAVLATIPDAAQAELNAINARYATMARGVNEGGDGYVPHMTWAGSVGREILARHGVDADAIAAALATFEA